MRRRLSTAFTLLSTTTLAAGVAAQPTKIGIELQVNSYTVAVQALPAVAADPEGDFVVVWHSSEYMPDPFNGLGQDGSDRGVFGQRFSSTGAKDGPEFLVNAITMYGQSDPDITMAVNGNFVVVWQDGNLDGFSLGIVARRFSSAGTAAGREFVVNTMTMYPQADPSVSSRANGDFVVVWTGDDGPGSPNYSAGIKGRVFSSAGAPITGEFAVNSHTEGQQYSSSVAMDSDGDFVVVWKSAQSGPYFQIVARRYTSAGDRVGDEFLVSPFTASQHLSAVTFAGTDFVVTWDAFLGGITGSEIFAKRFSSTGTPVATAFQVNTFTGFSSQSSPDVAAEANGDVVIVWHSGLQDGDGFALMGRRVSSAGAPVGGEFQINTTNASSQYEGSIAADANGRFVVAWQSTQVQYAIGQDGSRAGIFLQRFATGGLAPATLDIDGDGDVTALTDGRLVIRHLFGFSGATLLEGVDLTGCDRCEVGPIESYLASIADDLDIDLDTEKTALTDGMLVFRYLFEFTGASLVSGAVDEQNCMRCFAEDLEPHLEGLTTPGG